jgi:small multidrug resistance family-3 protein
MEIFKAVPLFFVTAIAEILGCYLPLLWLQHGKPMWLLVPAAASLGLFVWLLSLHPAASGRVYAAYGGIYVATAFLWMVFVDRVKLSLTDVLGVGLIVLGALIVVAGSNADRG